MRIEVSEFEIESSRVSFRSNLRRSATEAQLVLDSELEHKFAFDARFEFAVESEHDDLISNVRWRAR